VDRDVLDLLDHSLLTQLGERLADEARAIGGARVALYVLDLDGRCPPLETCGG
jgi:hypothetical protein